MNAQETLPGLVRQALAEAPPVSPEKEAHYVREFSRFVWLELAEYRSVKEEAKAWAEKKEGQR